MSQLMEASLAKSTFQMYNRSWKKLQIFAELCGLAVNIPVSTFTIMQFIAYLHGTGYSPAHISSVLSALAYFHKIQGLPDPTKHFAIQKLVAGARNLRARLDVRLPITVNILSRLLTFLQVSISSPYRRGMIAAIMILAFRGYFRIGELLPRCKSGVERVVQLNDITLGAESLQVVVRVFKHSTSQGPQVLHIMFQGHDPLCARVVLSSFLVARGANPGPLFSNVDSTPFLRRTFDQELYKLLRGCDLSPSVYKGHSFRIGAATDAAARGIPDAKIKAAGRWASEAYRKYIRLTN